ncbi:MAG: leucine-rich repeat domain-containing protein, partial [Clostridiales bacterium]|nr:leucine-rich repeat domain-containing protein [Clostridiales bacterium]
MGYSFLLDDFMVLRKDLSRCAGSNGLQKTNVVLPDGFEVIGPKTMIEYQCKKLFIPPSLKTIAYRAFDHAQIAEIDFGRCNLISIEYQAFFGCKAKTALPDSVKYIGDEAVRDLDLVNEGKLKLPSALRYLGKKAFNLSRVREIQVDEAVVTQDSNLDALIAMAEDEGKDGLILSVSREGKEV